MATIVYRVQSSVLPQSKPTIIPELYLCQHAMFALRLQTFVKGTRCVHISLTTYYTYYNKCFMLPYIELNPLPLQLEGLVHKASA